MAAVAPQTDDELRKARYDYMRTRAATDVNSSRQKTSEALDRRFASLGGLNSGAALKAQENVQRNADRASADRNMEIDSAEQGEAQQAREVEKNRQFARSEREASQGFQSGEAGKNRAFSSSEREASQGYGTKERLAGEKFSSGQADIDRKFRDQQATFDNAMKTNMFDFSKSSFAQQHELANKNYDLENKVQHFNMEMARAEANKKTILGRTGDLFTHWWKSGSSGLKGDGNNVFGGEGGLAVNAFGGGGGGFF